MSQVAGPVPEPVRQVLRPASCGDAPGGEETRMVRWPVIGGALLVAGAALGARAMLPQDAQAVAQRNTERSAQAEAAGLAEPFKGVTTNGTVVPGLFTIRSTGVSTEPARQAASAFLATLTPQQRARARFAVDDAEWRKWMNQHFYVRQGVGFNEMSPAQREGGIALLRASLSAKGLQLTRDIMRLNHTLGELNNGNFVEYGEWLYWITVMGEPSATEPWGWQLDGHHAIINYFVLGDQVVMTPAFWGSEPVTARSGKYKGTSVLQEERTAGLAFFGTLSTSQRAQAVISTSKTGNDNLGEAFKDNLVLDYAGLRGAELDPAQKRQLLALVGLFVGNLRDGHAAVQMREVERHLGDTWFAWIGGNDPGGVFYFRIHSPVVLIEFDHQRPANLRHLAADPSRPDPEHIHVVVRTPNGNDYGKDLLRQHYQARPHSHVGVAEGGSRGGGSVSTHEIETVRAFARRYTAAWCSHEPAAVAAFFSPGGSLKVNDSDAAIGRAAITEVARGFMTAFPDLQVLMDDLSVRGDRFVYRWTLVGTNTGPGGTGRRVRVSGSEEWRMGEDGLIRESLGHFDNTEYQRQLDGR